VESTYELKRGIWQIAKLFTWKSLKNILGFEQVCGMKNRAEENIKCGIKKKAG
jgi:hypothetical protein